MHIKTKTFAQAVEILEQNKFLPDDSVKFNQVLIELKRCPECASKLIYKGFSNATEFHNFGVCECGFYELYWTEKTILSFEKAANLHAA